MNNAIQTNSSNTIELCKIQARKSFQSVYRFRCTPVNICKVYEKCSRARYTGATEIAGLDIVGPVWQGWTLPNYRLGGKTIALAYTTRDK